MTAHQTVAATAQIASFDLVNPYDGKVGRWFATRTPSTGANSLQARKSGASTSAFEGVRRPSFISNTRRAFTFPMRNRLLVYLRVIGVSSARALLSTKIVGFLRARHTATVRDCFLADGSTNHGASSSS